MTYDDGVSMKAFPRRTYRSPSELLTDMRILLSRRKEIRALMRGAVITPAFRERLMLVVTEVNGCRYCSYAHARTALSTGVSREEIEALAAGTFEGSPPEEAPALLYAQHWAEANGKPDSAARRQIVGRYGEQAVGMMELALRMIRVGNLLGNTFDCLLYRISFGRWGIWQKAGLVP
jgi:AhpD family alkylhydroperoxidase